MPVVSMKKLLENGCHFGHQTKRWNPKMKPYIYAVKNGVHIIDLEKTQSKLDEAYEAMKAIVEKNGKILFVGTKKQAQKIINDEALRAGTFYINQRWLGGTLTNFKTIQKSIKTLLDIEEMIGNNTISIYPKKEQALKHKQAERLNNFLGGIKDMKKLPDAVFVVDPTEDVNAVTEARKLNIPVFGIIDTNCNPEVVDYGIPANDDAIRSITFIVGVMADAVVQARGTGILAFANPNEDLSNDITMADVIINVEKQNEENERRRRAKMEERRQREERGGGTRRPFERRPYDNRRPHSNEQSGERANTYAASTAAAKPVIVTPVAPVVETPVAKVETEEKSKV